MWISQNKEEHLCIFAEDSLVKNRNNIIVFSLQKIRIAALRMYTCCVDKIDYEEFFNSKFFILLSSCCPVIVIEIG